MHHLTLAGHIWQLPWRECAQGASAPGLASLGLGFGLVLACWAWRVAQVVARPDLDGLGPFSFRRCIFGILCFLIWRILYVLHLYFICVLQNKYSPIQVEIR